MSTETSLHERKNSAPVAIRSERQSALLAAGASAAVFGFDAVAVALGWTTSADRGTELAIHHDLPGAWHGVMQAASDIGQLSAVIAIGLGVALLAGRRSSARLAFFPVGASLFASVAASLLKLIFHRARPHLWAAAANAQGFSFPSGHATSSMAFAAACCYLSWKTFGMRAASFISTGLVFFALTVGISRIYLGVHWPTDIVGGYCVALGTTSLLTRTISD